MATMMTNSVAASSTVSAPAMTGRLRLGCNFRSLNNFCAHAIGGNVTRSYVRTSMLELRPPVLASWASFVCGETGDNVSSFAGPGRYPGQGHLRAVALRDMA
jgi:hypothetical protein